MSFFVKIAQDAFYQVPRCKYASFWLILREAVKVQMKKKHWISLLYLPISLMSSSNFLSFSYFHSTILSFLSLWTFPLFFYLSFFILQLSCYHFLAKTIRKGKAEKRMEMIIESKGKACVLPFGWQSASKKSACVCQHYFSLTYIPIKMSQLRPIYTVKGTIVLVLYECMFFTWKWSSLLYSKHTHMAHSGI